MASPGAEGGEPVSEFSGRSLLTAVGNYATILYLDGHSYSDIKQLTLSALTLIAEKSQERAAKEAEAAARR